MKKIQWKKYRVPWKVLILGLLIALTSGIAGEVFFNFHALTNKESLGSVQIPNDQIQTTDCEVSENGFKSKGKTMALKFSLEGRYINKLVYTYMSPYVNVDANVIVSEPNGYGETVRTVIEDKNSILHSFSVVPVNRRAEEIELQLLQPTDGLVITSITVSDAPSYSKIRFLFFAMAALLIYLLILNRDTLEKHTERMFLLIALPIGLLMILGFSPRETGWDEHIHFYRAYSLLYDLSGKDTMKISDGMFQYMETGMANEPFYFPRSQEENAWEREIGEIGRWDEGEELVQLRETNGLHLYSLAYVPQTLFLAVGLLFHAPFWVLVAMGRAGNLFFYCLLCYLGIRHMKRGKGILLVISLLPTSMLLAATYSYDAFINGWIVLGMSYIFTELLEKDRPVSIGNIIVFVAAVILASMPKAVYAPLLLLGILLPGKRFRDQRQCWIFRGILLLAVLLLMGTFLLPAAGNAEGITDTRGGNTNAGEQLRLILQNPLSYVCLLLRSVWENLVYYLFGRSVGGNLAYRGALTWANWLCPFLIFTIFTDNTEGYRNGLRKWQRIYMVFLVFGVICLIWTALYLSFTPVGLGRINGVQARYYIPLLVPVYMALQCDGIQNRMKKATYYRILSMGSLFFLLDGLWTGVVSMCF